MTLDWIFGQNHRSRHEADARRTCNSRFPRFFLILLSFISDHSYSVNIEFAEQICKKFRLCKCPFMRGKNRATFFDICHICAGIREQKKPEFFSAKCSCFFFVSVINEFLQNKCLSWHDRMQILTPISKVDGCLVPAELIRAAELLMPTLNRPNDQDLRWLCSRKSARDVRAIIISFIAVKSVVFVSISHSRNGQSGEMICELWISHGIWMINGACRQRCKQLSQ